MAEIVAVDPLNPDPNIILKAAGILQSGGLVAFPTETVYGLGADATNPEAIRRIYAAKGRPPTNPLIIHCESVDRVRRQCVTQWPETAVSLAQAFWPGPLTLILPKTNQIPEIATAGLAFVGVRIPETPVARALIAAADRPIAAPSANRSNRISPTLAEHVADDLGDRIAMILDAGPCRAGLESTVLDLTTDPPAILRPGPITAAEIARVIGLNVASHDLYLSEKLAHAAPGQSRVHYAPAKPLELWLERQPEIAEAELQDTALLIFGAGMGRRAFFAPEVLILKKVENSTEAERSLYATLRAWDADPRVKRIVVVMNEVGPFWAATRNRLSRAARVIHR